MTARQRQVEAELRAAARKLLDDLDAGKVKIAALRRAILAEPGARLLASKVRRRLAPVWSPAAGKTVGRNIAERLDLIEYRRPGGPRRPSFWLLEWSKTGWQDRAVIATRAEALVQFDAWHRNPPWLRAPLLIEECEESIERERQPPAK